MCKKLLVLCLALAMASVSYGDTTVQHGNWEGVMDGWNAEGGATTTYSSDSRVVTLGSQALGVWAVDQWQTSLHTWVDNATAYSWNIQNGGTISIDVTVLAEEWELGSAIGTDGAETHWGIKPLENIIIQNDGVGWWLQLAPDVQPNFNGLGDRNGVWKPEDGDQQFTYTFTVPTMSFTSGFDFHLITNRGAVDIAGASYVDNMVGVYVPEPATIAMLGLGGLALIRRKK